MQPKATKRARPNSDEKFAISSGLHIVDSGTSTVASYVNGKAVDMQMEILLN